MEEKSDGWIKLHRQTIESAIFSKPEYLKLWIYILLKANHRTKEFIFNNYKKVVQKGSFITGRKKLSSETNIQESKIERILKYLENEQQIEQEKTYAYRLIIVKNWDKYQQSEQVNEQQMNNKRTASEQPVNTTKNDKNDKNDKKKNNMPKQIFDYWNELFKDSKPVKILSDSRRQKLKTRIGETLFDYKEIFLKTYESDWLCSQKWCNFDWIIKNKENYVKILEGKYDDKE